ncbi:MAG TPA: glycoside hydrolase family 44 protein [Candidatus Acidoferrum sp.]|nr:glycoside hydrolase family 44 protein [Candidatus Acidoferrum sp.]
MVFVFRLSRPLALLVTSASFLLGACGGGYGGGGNGGGGGNPPGTPTGLTATGGNAVVSLSWTAGSGATSYYVKRATTSGNETQIASVAATTYADTTVANGTKYYYVVSAYNSYGTSGNSNEVNATPSAPAPAAPTGLSATASNAQVALAWNASTGATSYNVKRSTTSGGETLLTNVPAGSFTDSGLTNGTVYYYVVSAMLPAGESANSTEVSATPTNGSTPDVTITVNPAVTQPISPYIYGINSYSGIPNAPKQLTFDRAGGNRWTAYNWENNFSNAGSDYIYSNDNYLCNGSCNAAIPGEAVRMFITADQTAGLASLVTFQLQGLVSADGNGAVSTMNPPDMTRFKTVIDKKSTKDAAPFTLNPPTTDAYVYMDEFAWALDQKFSGMNIFGVSPMYPTFISLDNEPDLWNATHFEVQGSTNISAANFITNTTILAEALKDQFPNLTIFGPVNYGFNGIFSWQGGLTPTWSGNNWFADQYIGGMATAKAAYGKPVVDVYDFHWYSEATDGTTRVTSMTGSNLADPQRQAIVQSPRSLWDPSFVENSWITNSVTGGQPIQILTHLQSKINATNPGMRLSITEYENGGFNDIAGTIAQADDLGIFGSMGLFAANFWPPSGTYSYTMAGFLAYRDFDGAGANFGDTSLQSTSSNMGHVVVYASTDTTTAGRVVLVAINRSNASKVTVIDGQALTGSAHLFQMTGASAASQSVVKPVPAGTLNVSGSTLVITLPAYSVTTIDVH